MLLTNTINQDEDRIELYGDQADKADQRNIEGNLCNLRHQYSTSNVKAWYTLLEGKTFNYITNSAKYNLRKEIQRNGEYWYLYKKAGGKLKKRYVGLFGSNLGDGYRLIEDAIKRLDQ